MEFSRQEYWRELPFPTSGDLPHPGIEPTSLTSPALTGRFSTTAPPGKPLLYIYLHPNCLACVSSLGPVNQEEGGKYDAKMEELSGDLIPFLTSRAASVESRNLLGLQFPPCEVMTTAVRPQGAHFTPQAPTGG